MKAVRMYSNSSDQIDLPRIELRCPHGRIREAHDVNWLSARRDTICRRCGNVIVLNTSAIREEIVRVRRQASALRSQLMAVFGNLLCVPRLRAPADIPAAELKLAALSSQWRGTIPGYGLAYPMGHLLRRRQPPSF